MRGYPMDGEAAADQIGEAPETTLARTRTLLDRSRTTLKMLRERLRLREDDNDPPIERLTTVSQ